MKMNQINFKILTILTFTFIDTSIENSFIDLRDECGFIKQTD